MDLKRLRTFVAVADLGTVSKAALRLRTSQSATAPSRPGKVGSMHSRCSGSCGMQQSV